MLINLLNNAFYAVRERATHINGQYIPMVSVQAVQRVDAIAVQATGDGPGIPDAVRACIFEPFFTTKPTGSGTGLALSMSYDIIT